MAKVVRAFSIDPDVARKIDKIAEQESTWEKKPNKSRVVNMALRWYYIDTDTAWNVSMQRERADYWQQRALQIASNGGVKHHLWGLLKALGRLFRSGNEHQ